MRAVNRYITLKEVRENIINGEGTVIGEYVTAKGPFRLWWTHQNIAATCPYPFCKEKHPWWCEQDYSEFFSWCVSRFTSAESGEARLVDIPEAEEASLSVELKTLRAEDRFVSIRSPRPNRDAILAQKR